jgi:ABC-2 type transport system ATP-binding protein
VRQVVERRSTGRADVLVAELTGPVRDPRWQASPLTLEELVLAYLRDPDAGTRSTPLTAIGGAR